MDKNKILNRQEYDEWMRSLDPNICTFCQWDEYQFVLKEFSYWVWIANKAPYWNWHTIIMPKRHFVEFEEQTFKEISEFLDVFSYAKRKILDAGLLRADGKPVEKIVYFARFRANRFDPISKTVRPDHYHFHLSPDKDHLWDTTLDAEAHRCDYAKLI
jgi:diadenosine tetraphosphate (Ap4A) HIT family hydrolase